MSFMCFLPCTKAWKLCIWHCLEVRLVSLFGLYSFVFLFLTGTIMIQTSNLPQPCCKNSRHQLGFSSNSWLLKIRALIVASGQLHKLPKIPRLYFKWGVFVWHGACGGVFCVSTSQCASGADSRLFWVGLGACCLMSQHESGPQIVWS